MFAGTAPAANVTLALPSALVTVPPFELITAAAVGGARALGETEAVDGGAVAEFGVPAGAVAAAELPASPVTASAEGALELEAGAGLTSALGAEIGSAVGTVSTPPLVATGAATGSGFGVVTTEATVVSFAGAALGSTVTASVTGATSGGAETSTGSD